MGTVILSELLLHGKQLPFLQHTVRGALGKLDDELKGLSSESPASQQFLKNHRDAFTQHKKSVLTYPILCDMQAFYWVFSIQLVRCVRVQDFIDTDSSDRC